MENNNDVEIIVLPRIKLLGGLLFVGIIHVTVMVALVYAGRMNYLAGYGSFCFATVMVAALDAFVYVAWRLLPQNYESGRKLLVAAVLGICSFLISLMCVAFVIFNAWGS